ncbi:MAG TPA: hypothetical protein VJU02_02190 [Nitrospiraceae bacterium]|nr:hypothetical protein [Nitrospiraceae bacterium]
MDRLQNESRCVIVSQARKAIHAASRNMIALVLAFILLGANWSSSWGADPPCDKYPSGKQIRCAEIWRELNKEDGPLIAQFGLDQLKRREEGKINAEQHLGENMAFIKQSTEKRLARLKERMAKE